MCEEMFKEKYVMQRRVKFEGTIKTDPKIQLAQQKHTERRVANMLLFFIDKTRFLPKVTALLRSMILILGFKPVCFRRCKPHTYFIGEEKDNKMHSLNLTRTLGIY